MHKAAGKEEGQVHDIQPISLSSSSLLRISGVEIAEATKGYSDLLTSSWVVDFASAGR
jgi:hypothetical protein